MIVTSFKANGPLPYMLGILAIVWIPFGLSDGIKDLFSFHFTSLHDVVIAIGALLFVGLYLWGSYENVRYLITTTPPLKRADTSVWLLIAVLIALSMMLVYLNEKDWGSCFIFVCAYSSTRLSTVQTVWITGGIMLYALIGAVVHAVSWSELGSALFLVGIVSFIVVAMVRSYRTGQELRLAREEIAHLAVTTERLRIARDLHDLLGHNLSLIALKSELAGRLLRKNVELASVEISDIEQVARRMLQEVREAVGSYRQPTLVSELYSAQEILNAAGIGYTYEGDEQILNDLPQAVESVFAWTVREGVTNIIRHSRSRQCIIRIMRSGQSGSVEIIDDGTGMTGQEHRPGNGLRGLTERVEALAGQLSAGPALQGGFCLAVSFPLTQQSEKPGSASYISNNARCSATC
ncbi:hypothetical protein KTT_47150 [Tengunoibacter tsumagoiensis]|uniref:Signal transduction histidine kinase subgroup 3 dimerisation and phosphoacceptor domain-containing protein n=1 Tax=Tengunoibacter tsumagoiensis TaxID=2014871 RepID=A0A402A750_9CHLR|nr:hypothetical protein KTT_47150 [Tengunoibacter tsumagoiensis]